MKHTSKRLQALVLVLAMCVSFLQIPSFAVAHSDNNAFVVKSVDVDKDGTLTIVKKCTDHGTCTETVTGKVVENATKTGYQAVDANGKKLNDVDKVEINTTKPTCIKPGTITYLVTVDNRTWTTEAYETTPATGDHKYNPIDKTKNYTYKGLMKDPTFELVSDTANCNAIGKAVFAKKCSTNGCNAVSEKEVYRVTVDHTVGHQYIVDEKNKAVVYKEEITAPTCKENGGEGSELHYYVCKFCNAKLYFTNDDGSEVSSARSLAKTFTVSRLNHTFKYTVKASRPATVGKTLSKDDFYVDSECTACKDENATDWQADPIKAEVVADKTVAPKFDCTVGSQTYKVTYEVTDFTKKDANGNFGTKELTEEVTVDYYPANYVGHKWGDIYVPDEDSVVKATCTKDGHYNLIDTCSVCGEKYIYATIKIPATGKHTAAAAKKENVVAATTKKGGSYDLVVRCADCGEIISSTHKTTAKIVVKASKVTKATNVKGKKAKITVKTAASVTGYQIQYGTKKNFKGAKSVKTKATTKTVSKLAKKKYYVRVRTYKVVSGKTYYSSWSGAKTVTIKK